MSVQVSRQLVDFVRPSEHSKFSPSSTDRWMKCPASIKLTENIPEETSKYAAEGTLAHQICEDLFAHKYLGKEKTPELMMCEDEMLEHAETYYDCIVGWLNNTDDIGDVVWYGVEAGIPIFPELGCFGTADFVIVGTKATAMIDFKYGKGVSVGAKTSQLRNYILGIYRHLIDVPEDYSFYAVVVQPRTDYVPKVHQYSLKDIQVFEAEVYKALLQEQKPGNQPVMGNHCFWCKARRTNDPLLKCPAQKAKADEAMNENFDKFFADMNTGGGLPGKSQASNEARDKAMIKLITLLPLLKETAKSCEEELMFRMRNGEDIPGIKRVGVFGRSKWSLDDEEMGLKIRGVYPSVDPFVTTRKLKTITQIKKEVGRKNFNESLVVRPMVEKLSVNDSRTQDCLGELVNYNKALGLNLDN